MHDIGFSRRTTTLPRRRRCCQPLPPTSTFTFTHACSRYESMKAMQASRQAKQQAGRQQAGRQDGRLRRLRSHYLPSGEHAGAGPHHPAFSGHTHTHAPHALTPTAHTDCLRMSRWTPRTPSPVQHRSYAHLEASTAVAAAPPRHVHCARATGAGGWGVAGQAVDI